MTSDAAAPTSDAPGEGPPWRGMLVALGGALLLYALVPLVAIGTDWGLVNYDDPYLVSPDNPAIGQGLLGGLPELLRPTGRPFMDAWLPLYYWSLGLDHALFGEWWMGWHLHSALLHGLGAALAVWIARELGLGRSAAVTAGLIFALHPVATESVAWIASRKDQLSFAWAAAGALCYLRGVRTGRGALHLAGALLLGVGLLAKGTVLVLPFLLAVHAVLIRDREIPLARRLAPVVPYALVTAVLTVVHLQVARSAGTVEGTGAGIAELLVADLAVAWSYARSLLLPWPAWGSVEHGLDAFDPAVGQVAAGAVVVLVWLAAVAVAWRRRPVAAAALLAVPLALAPFNNLLPRTSVLFAERYVYVALLPFALGVGALLASRTGRAAPFVAAAVLGALAAPRIGVWQDSVALWRDAEATAPQSAFVRMQLADAYAERGAARGPRARDWSDLAESEWRAARRLALADLARVEREHGARPRALEVRIVQAGTGLGTFLLVTAGGHDDARERVEEAVAVLGESAELLRGLEGTAGHEERLELALTNRAAALEALGRHDEAFEAWRDAALRLPDRPRPHNALARLHLAAGRAAEAVGALAESARVAPDDPAAARERADIRLAMGDAAGAKRELTGALAAHPDDVGLLAVTAQLDLLLMRPLDAEKRLRHALELRPDDAEIRTALASALVQQAQSFAARDDAENARRAAREAADVAPGSSAPDQILGIIARRAGNLDEAVGHFREAYALQPDGERIREALASVLVERATGYLDDGSEPAAFQLLEEALAVQPPRIATPEARIEHGARGWPAPAPDAAPREIVVRQAALRGLAFLAMGRHAEALLELAVAERGTEDGAPELRRVVLELLTKAAFGAGDRERALAAARELPALAARLAGGDVAEALEQLAAAHVEAGIAARARSGPAAGQAAFAEARAVLERADAEGLAASRVHLRTGEILFAEERFLQATREFDRAVEADPRDPDAYLDRAAVWRSHFLIEEDTSFLKGAEEDLRKALSVAPADPRVMAALGETLLLARRPSEAFPWLQRAVLADPSQRGARSLLADLLVRAGRSNLEKHAETRAESELEAAESAAARALALDPPAPDALLLRADVLRVGGRWGDALDAIREAVDRFPAVREPRDALASYYRDLGHGFLLQRRTGQAVEAFRQALAVEGADVDLASVRERLLGVAMSAYREGLEAREAGDLDTAADRFRLSIRADETPEGWFQLGNALAAGSDEDLETLRAAESAYSRALDLRVDFQGARLNRAGLLLRLGRPGEAAEAYRRWLDEAAPDDPNRAAVQHQIEQAERIEREVRESLPEPGGGDSE